MKAIILSTVLPVLFTTGLQAQEPAVVVQDIDREFITLHATGRAEALPDRSIASVLVTTEDTSLTEALNRNGLHRQDLAAKLRAQGLADVRPASVSSRSGFSGGKHTVTNRVEVVLKSDTDLARLTGVIDLWPGVRYNGVRKDLAARAELQQSAAIAALAALKLKKQTYEESLGIKLKLFTFQEEPGTLECSSTGMRILTVPIRGRYKIVVP